MYAIVEDIFMKFSKIKQLWSIVYTVWMNAWAHIVQHRFL
jgi:hypothetical protein